MYSLPVKNLTVKLVNIILFVTGNLQFISTSVNTILLIYSFKNDFSKLNSVPGADSVICLAFLPFCTITKHLPSKALRIGICKRSTLFVSEFKSEYYHVMILYPAFYALI